MLDWILRIFFGRLQVRSPKTVPLCIEILRTDLKKKGFPHPESITDAVAEAIVYDAARRAAEIDKDGALRTVMLLEQVEYAADEIIKAFSSAPDADSRIRGILEFHKAI